MQEVETTRVFAGLPGKFPQRRFSSLRVLLGLNAACFAAGGLARLAGAVEIPLPFCLFRKFTGLPCLTCGCTRSLLAWTSLDIERAFYFNPLFAALCLGLVGWLLVVTGERLSGRTWMPSWHRLLPPRTYWKLLAALAALNWIYLWLNLPQ